MKILLFCLLAIVCRSMDKKGPPRPWKKAYSPPRHTDTTVYGGAGGGRVAKHKSRRARGGRARKKTYRKKEKRPTPAPTPAPPVCPTLSHPEYLDVPYNYELGQYAYPPLENCNVDSDRHVMNGTGGVCLGGDNVFCSYTLKSACLQYVPESNGKQEFYPGATCASMGFTELVKFNAAPNSAAVSIYYCLQPSQLPPSQQTNICCDDGYTETYNGASMCAYGDNRIYPSEDTSNCGGYGYTNAIFFRSKGQERVLCVKLTPDINGESLDIDNQVIVEPQLASAVCISTTPNSVGCPATLPTYGCNDACQLNNGIRKATIASVQLLFAVTGIPGLDDFIGGLLNAFWTDGEAQYNLAKEMAAYVDAEITQAKSDILTSLVSNEFEKTNTNLKNLRVYINIDAPSGLRGSTLAIIMDSCLSMRIALSDRQISALQALPYISSVGDLCIPLFVSRAYNYSGLTNITESPALKETLRAELDQAVTDFTDLAKEVNDIAILWRTKVSSSGPLYYRKYDGKYGCTLLCNYHYGEVSDSRCRNVNGLVGNLAYYSFCCNGPNMAQMETTALYYFGMVRLIFTSNFIGMWGANSISSWKYFNTTAIDSGTLPQPTSAVAMSVFNSPNNPSDMGPFRFGHNVGSPYYGSGQWLRYNDEKNLIDALKLANSSDPNSVRLLSMRVTKGNSIIAICMKTMVDGTLYETTTGRRCDDDTWALFDFTADGTVMTGWDYAGCVLKQKPLESLQNNLKICQGNQFRQALATAPGISAYNANSTSLPTGFYPRIVGVTGFWTLDPGIGALYYAPIWYYHSDGPSDY